jgi:thiamine-monophosphate kinase
LNSLPLREKPIIAGIRSRTKLRAGVRLGIGDDCAVLRIPPGHEALVTTDFSLEGVHFCREWHTPEVVGHRCLTRGLSDIAAMGGRPTAAFLSLALPQNLPQRWVDGFFDGLLNQADTFQITLAGGDVAQSPNGILADIVVLGTAPKGKAVLRSGAKPGDRIYVTGELGGSAAALKMLFAGRKLRAADFPQHFHPQPRVAAGEFLRKNGLASAMIDISDGFSTDLAHICEESGVGAEIRVEAIPLASIGKPAHEVDLQSALHGGEDYELLFTAPGSKHVPAQIAGVAITEVGRVTRARRMILLYGTVKNELVPNGWEHFRTR